MWREMPADEKKQWLEAGRRDKERFKRQYDAETRMNGGKPLVLVATQKLVDMIRQEQKAGVLDVNMKGEIVHRSENNAEVKKAEVLDSILQQNDVLTFDNVVESFESFAHTRMRQMKMVHRNKSDEELMSILEKEWQQQQKLRDEEKDNPAVLERGSSEEQERKDFKMIENLALNTGNRKRTTTKPIEVQPIADEQPLDV